MFDPTDISPDYALVWPRDVFRRELSALLLDDQGAAGLQERLALLFEEAFIGQEPHDDVAAAKAIPVDPWATAHPASVEGIARLVLTHIDALRPHRPRQYYRERVAGWSPMTDFDVLDRTPLADVGCDWANLVQHFDRVGYFDLAGGDQCVDGQGIDAHLDTMRAKVSELCGISQPWPPTPTMFIRDHPPALSLDEFFTLVEVAHDLVARPRRRRWHDYGRHHDFDSFDRRSGQALYRGKVNDLLTRRLPTYRLADDGEDAGMVVTTTPDPRADLERIARQDVPDGNDGPIDHAIALFRRRGATVEGKRSACIALARVLESRRDLLKDALLSKDEGALFELANKYQIRHHRADQHLDYAEEFLDWIFWNFLTTVELSNRLIRRSQLGGAT